MRESDLRSPNIGATGFHLRRIAAKAISYIETIAPRYPGGIHPDASDLRGFFIQCADALAPFDATPGTAADLT